MSRYIDADNALRMMQNSKQDCPLKDDKKNIWDVAHDCAISCVEAVHTADVVEVRHAEWKYGKENGQYGYYCTICKAGFVGENAEWIAKEHNFCPKCGAKMDGERSTKDAT